MGRVDVVCDRGTFRGVNGIELYWQCWQPEQAPVRAVLAIVHGFGEHSGRYASLADYFVARGYAVYGFDQRGHGRSPGRRGYIREWGEFRGDVRAFLMLVRGRESDRPLFLFGHSLGALIALEYGLHHPEDLDGLIASGAPLGDIGVPRILFTLSRILSRLWPTFSLDVGSNFAALSRDPAVEQDWRTDPLVHSRGTARLGTELPAAIARTNARAAELRPPLLMLHGAADRVVPPQGSRDFFARVGHPEKERREYEGGYHEPHNDVDAPQVLADLERWLERRLSAQPHPAPVPSPG